MTVPLPSACIILIGSADFDHGHDFAGGPGALHPVQVRGPAAKEGGGQEYNGNDCRNRVVQHCFSSEPPRGFSHLGSDWIQLAVTTLGSHRDRSDLAQLLS